ncbi:MAG: ATP-binding protein involved in chromosome partitioning [Candidatus Tokpelaia sp. JSC188]|nr:MAG: ATP-binding protein involved in chromosome partitioning [Candidatus Tokpelaia sp. JSC188]
MASITYIDILKKLKQLKDPDSSRDIISLGLVSEIVIIDGKVFFSISVPPERAEELELLRQTAEKMVTEIDGVSSAVVTLTAERKPAVREKSSSSLLRSIDRKRPGLSLPRPIEGVKHIIAVASGKGGVGKSTIAINLALALKENGFAVGLLDADIYGPSLPWLTGLHRRPRSHNKKLEPLEWYGMKLISMGFLVDKEVPMLWRGPMVMTAITQMLRDVLWAPLDMLVIDMPPGTGDAHLTLAQQVPISGSVIVSTPQNLALVDARKGLEMFMKVGVPILGMIENMSYFIAPDTGKRYDIFGHGNVRLEAEKRKVAFLGELPLDPKVRATSDEGKPIILAVPDSVHAMQYRCIAQIIMKSL